MASEPHRRSGQAIMEFVIALLAMALIVSAAVEFLPALLEDFGLLKAVREEAGSAALASEHGTSGADRQEEFDLGIPELLLDGGAESGRFAEKAVMPAANLAAGEAVHIPSVSGATEKMRHSSRAGTSEFVSSLTFLPPGEALARAAASLAGAGWRRHAVGSGDALLFTLGDETAPSAIAAVHAMPAPAYDADGTTVLTISARTAGAAP